MSLDLNIAVKRSIYSEEKKLFNMFFFANNKGLMPDIVVVLKRSSWIKLGRRKLLVLWVAI